MTNELKVENLNFDTILNDINFNIKEGTITALMGKSGSGKTLLLKAIAGLIKHNGMISINGTLVTEKNIDQIRKNIGIYLNLDTLDKKDVFSNIIEPLNNLNYKEVKSKKIIYEIAKKLDIENLLYKKINELSYSQKKVIAFAQSIIHEPQIILIDGLFDSLDIYYKTKIFNYLKYLIKSKKAIVIFATNNNEDILYADNLLVIKQGNLVINGEVKFLVNDESLFIKNNIKLPFIIDLSYKLKAYELIDEIILNNNEMVNKLWK